VPSGTILSFGPFQLDLKSRRLLRQNEPVALGARQFDLLHVFATRPRQIVSKDALIEAAWRDVAVTDNSLEQAISGLRKMLGPEYIETHARRGYRFAADVTRSDARETDAALDALLAPHRMWIEGRAALETLEGDQIVRAREVFERVVSQVPEQAPAHIGLANACAMQFEMTRADREPDRRALDVALTHAREACRLDAQYGEAWATLGFVLDRTGDHADALAALRRSVALESDNWRHRLRLSYASWGEERLREARRTLALLPGFPLAHWLAATVHVARQAFGEAERELSAGIAAQGARDGLTTRFTAIALHWLRGLIRFAGGDDTGALEDFDRELSHETSGHLYARECCANTWYAIGAVRLSRGQRAEARTAFEQAIDRVPLHPMALAGLAVLGAGDGTQGGHASIASSHNHAQSSIHATIARAAVSIFVAGDLALPDSVRAVDEALAAAPPGDAGWLLPIEPLLGAHRRPDAWAPVLARLRTRAA
jgi:DNA-binding winged helix-turn-helix (wHTH) protein/Flp pilus assembly protein TadD